MSRGCTISLEKQELILAVYDRNPATSIKTIAKEVGCAQQTANSYLRRSGRDVSNKRFRKGLPFTDTDGYVVLYRPEHFGAKSCGRIREHVEKACNALGRRLRSDEVVHHINGDKQDNSNSNLLICSKGYHTWLHHEMSRRYQKEHFTNPVSARIL